MVLYLALIQSCTYFYLFRENYNKFRKNFEKHFEKNVKEFWRKFTRPFGRNLNLGKFERIMEKIFKNFGVNSSKLKYAEAAVVLGGIKYLIVDRLNDSSSAPYSELYSFLFIWRKFERILEKHERI